MTARRLAQILPDRSQWLILVIIVGIIVALLGFGNIAILKAQATARRAVADSKQAQLLSQKDMLEERIYQAQQRQNIERRGYDYFRRTMPDVTVVVPETASGGLSKPVPMPSSPPHWLEWIRMMALP